MMGETAFDEQANNKIQVAYLKHNIFSLERRQIA